MQFGLNKAVNRTLELATANSVVTNKNASEVDYSYLVQETARAAEVPEENVTLRKRLECDEVPQASFEGMCDPDESIARYVQIEAKKSFSPTRSEEHTSELQSLMRISYAVFCLNKKKQA